MNFKKSTLRLGQYLSARTRSARARYLLTIREPCGRIIESGAQSPSINGLIPPFGRWGCNSIKSFFSDSVGSFKQSIPCVYTQNLS